MSKPTTHEEYLATVPPEKQADMKLLYDLMARCAPDYTRFVIKDIMAFGLYRYKTASGREGDWMHLGLVTNKSGFSVYVCAIDEQGHLAEQAKSRLGKASVGKSCIRFRRAADLNLNELELLLKRAVEICGPG